MDALWKDIRQGTRMLRKSPGFTAVAVLTLSLGIGANTAIFSMADSILLRPLPVADAARLTELAFRQKHGPLTTNFSIAEYRDLRAQTTDVLSGLLGYQFGIDGLSINGKADRIVTNFVSGNYFSALGIKPALGRFILPSEGATPGADPVIVLSYGYWQTHLGGDPAVVGSKVLIDGHPITIVGIAPKSFHGLYAIADIEGYMPLGMASVEAYPSDFMSNRALRNMYVLGWLRPGTNLAHAQAALNFIAQRMSQQYPESDKDLSLEIYPEVRARPDPDPKNTVAIIAALFLGFAALVLVLACVNVANILLVRATIREREMAIRAALGAARSALVRQLLVESILLALAGGVAGVVLGYCGSSSISALHLSTDLPVRLDFGFEWRVFSYAFGAALLTGLVVGIVPALRSSRANLNDILHKSGRGVIAGRSRLRSVLVVTQVGGSLTLLIIAGLFTRSLGQVQRTKLGFDPSQIVNLTMDPNEIGYTPQQGLQFYKAVLGRVRALPGVVSASIANSVPMGYYGNGDNLVIEGYETPAGQPPPGTGYNVVSPGYFQTMKIAMLHGRAFRDADDDKAPYVAVLNESMAKRFWPNKDPIGRHFKLVSDPQHSVQIVGIAKDSHIQGLTGPINPFLYLPFAQHYAANSLETLQVRTAARPIAMVPELERVIASLAPSLPVFDVNTMVQALYTLNGLLMFQVGAALAAALGLLGLVLAVVGVYGVISYAASQQTHEIGIRIAMGAQPANILRMIFKHGLLIVAAGLVFGIVAAIGASTIVGNFLILSATDPVTYLTVSLLLSAVALLACYIPARRAMKVDPMTALKYE
ncbi:MAG TPA: ABC transporter permease [Bryobacteraceae bacterium]|jgi:predicted permease|nr:ABC transporter permease [Bryobacteraceae bacterium]